MAAAAAAAGAALPSSKAPSRVDNLTWASKLARFPKRLRKEDERDWLSLSGCGCGCGCCYNCRCAEPSSRPDTEPSSSFIIVASRQAPPRPRPRASDYERERGRERESTVIRIIALPDSVNMLASAVRAKRTCQKTADGLTVGRRACRLCAQCNKPAGWLAGHPTN